MPLWPLKYAALGSYTWCSQIVFADYSRGLHFLNSPSQPGMGNIVELREKGPCEKVSQLLVHLGLQACRIVAGCGGLWVIQDITHTLSQDPDAAKLYSRTPPWAGPAASTCRQHHPYLTPATPFPSPPALGASRSSDCPIGLMY